ncbi:MAG: hypothetical protein WCS37_05050 [Chloroflexota bacterium]
MISQVLEQALHDTQQIGPSVQAEGTNQINAEVKPVVLLPVLPSNAIDEVFRRFGFKSNSRTHLIKQNLFPKGAPLWGRAMSTSLYPSLVIDLIALLARQEQPQTGGLAQRLRLEISELVQTPLFNEVLQSLARQLPIGQPVTLAFINRLFWPIADTEKAINVEFAKVGGLKLDWFSLVDYQTQQYWYRLALVQQQVRRLLFMTGATLGASRLTSPRSIPIVVPPVSEVKTGYVDGDGHSPEGYMRAILKYTFGVTDLETEGGIGGAELAYEEETEIKYQTLEWMGCNLADTPIARIEATLDQFDSRLLFYLPGFVPPETHKAIEQRTTYLEKHALTLEKLPDFDLPLTEEDLTEVMVELEQEGYV